MKNNRKVDFKIRKNRLLLWLIVVLTILLVATIGVFVFLSLNEKYHFACVFECKQRESVVARKQDSPPTEIASVAAVCNVTTASLEIARPEIETSTEKSTQDDGKTHTSMTHKTTTVVTVDHNMIIRSTTPTSTTIADRKTTSVVKTRSSNVTQTTPVNVHNTRKPRLWNLKGYITVTGNISFKGKPPKRFPRNSRLMVEFTDDSLQDVPSILLGKTVVDLSKYRRSKTLSYKITCKKPKFSHSYYSVSALLNVGRKKNKNDWIRKGDYFTDTFFTVYITKFKRKYIRNIQLVKYTN